MAYEERPKIKNFQDPKQIKKFQERLVRSERVSLHVKPKNRLIATAKASKEELKDKNYHCKK